MDGTTDWVQSCVLNPDRGPYHQAVDGICMICESPRGACARRAGAGPTALDGVSRRRVSEPAFSTPGGKQPQPPIHIPRPRTIEQNPRREAPQAQGQVQHEAVHAPCCCRPGSSDSSAGCNCRFGPGAARGVCLPVKLVGMGVVWYGWRSISCGARVCVESIEPCGGTAASWRRNDVRSGERATSQRSVHRPTAGFFWDGN